MTMKKILTIVLGVLTVCSAVYAQNESKEARKARTAVSKQSEKELNSKASKEARKQAKVLKKQGWVVMPGALPLEKQLDRSYKMQYEFDEDGNAKFIFAEGNTTGKDYNAAKDNATFNAKIALAGQIEENITALTEGTVGYEDGVTINETVKASKSLIAQKLARTLPIMECCRTTKDGKCEVLVRLAYNYSNAMDVAIDTIEQELKAKGLDLHEELDRMWKRD